MGRLRKEEREKFIGNFAQAKNLIDNQLKVGFHIKAQKKLKEDNRKRAEALKVKKSEPTKPLQSKVYGVEFLQFNDPTNSNGGGDGSTQLSQTDQKQPTTTTPFIPKGRTHSQPSTTQQAPFFPGVPLNPDASAHKNLSLLPPFHDTNFSELYKKYASPEGSGLPTVRRRNRDFDVFKTNSNQVNSRRNFALPSTTVDSRLPPVVLPSPGRVLLPSLEGAPHSMRFSMQDPLLDRSFFATEMQPSRR